MSLIRLQILTCAAILLIGFPALAQDIRQRYEAKMELDGAGSALARFKYRYEFGKITHEIASCDVALRSGYGATSGEKYQCIRVDRTTMRFLETLCVLRLDNDLKGACEKETAIKPNATAPWGDIVMVVPVEPQTGQVQTLMGVVVPRLDDNQQAFFDAAVAGNLPKIRDAVTKGARIDETDAQGRTALILAAEKGHTDTVRYLLEKGNGVQRYGNDDRKALFAAAEHGFDGVVTALLEAGVDANSKDRSDGTALIAAAARGHEAVVDALLKHGADATCRGKFAGTALFQAALNGHGAIFKKLLNAAPNVLRQGDTASETLRVAAWKGYGDIVAALLENGIAVNNNAGGIALVTASEGGHGAVVKMLLQKGADVNFQDKDGKTALYAASRNGHGAVVDTLLANNPKLDLTTGFSRGRETALYAASKGGYAEIVKVLLKKKANPNIKASFSDTALDVAKSKEVARLLKAAGAK